MSATCPTVSRTCGQQKMRKVKWKCRWTGSHACMLTAFWLTSAGTRYALPKSWGSAAHISMNCSRKAHRIKINRIQTRSKMSQNSWRQRPQGVGDRYINGLLSGDGGCPTHGFAVKKKYS